jgi:hypothetical protein
VRNYISTEKLDEHLEKLVSRVDSTRLKFLRRQVIDNSNFQASQVFDLRALTRVDAIRLAVLSWYLPLEIGCLLKVDLLLGKNSFDLETEGLLEFLCESKVIMLKYLQETDLWHTRDFFGNLFAEKEILALVHSLKVLQPTVKKPKRALRKRGYDDHGALKPSWKWLPTSDISLTELHRKLEEERKSARDTFAFLEGFLE